MKKIIYLFGVLFFIGCSQSKIVQPKIDLLEKIDLDNNISRFEPRNEYYFQETKDKIFNIQKKYSIEWSNIIINKNGNIFKFSIMKSPVSKNNIPLTNLSVEEMNDICMKKYKATLAPAYVFDFARQKKLIYQPIGLVDSEIISPIDEEEDIDFISSKDKMILPDGMVFKFDWNTQKYIPVSDIYKSKTTTFRCVKSRD